MSVLTPDYSVCSCPIANAQEAMPESKYPLKAPPHDLLTEVGAMVSTSQPPRYEGQLRRGYAFDEGEGEGPKTDDMIEQMEKGMGQQQAQDDEAREQAETGPKPKAKAKGKSKAKGESKS